MQCPKCQFEQQNNSVCKRCGIVFEKYYQYHDQGNNKLKPIANLATDNNRHSITQLPWVKSLNTMIFYGSLLLLIVAFFKRDDFPVGVQYDPALQQEPVQVPVKAEPFNLTKNHIDYQIQPLYQYQLNGLVVSYRHHNSKYGLHKLWNDHLNIADICVVWGKNATNLNLNAIDFWSGIFTCNFETKDSQVWQQFKPKQISNNHLLTDNEEIRDIIADVHIGDQIQISGVLAKYKNNQGFNRGTSITRTDTGNGACETIYVNDFQITQPSTNAWRKVYAITLVSLLLSIGWWLLGIARE